VYPLACVSPRQRRRRSRPDAASRATVRLLAFVPAGSVTPAPKRPVPAPLMQVGGLRLSSTMIPAVLALHRRRGPGPTPPLWVRIRSSPTGSGGRRVRRTETLARLRISQMMPFSTVRRRRWAESDTPFAACGYDPTRARLGADPSLGRRPRACGRAESSMHRIRSSTEKE
jgi:hypothetical protein